MLKSIYLKSGILVIVAAFVVGCRPYSSGRAAPPLLSVPSIPLSPTLPPRNKYPKYIKVMPDGTLKAVMPDGSTKVVKYKPYPSATGDYRIVPNQP
jgi:hypothetical protein